MRDLYISRIGLPILLQEICGPILGINSSQTLECGNWDWGRAIPRKGMHRGDFPCGAAKKSPNYRSTTSEPSPIQSRFKIYVADLTKTSWFFPFSATPMWTLPSLIPYTATKIPFMYSQKRNCTSLLSPNFHIHVSVSDLYIPRIPGSVHIFSCSRIGRPNK